MKKITFLFFLMVLSLPEFSQEIAKDSLEIKVDTIVYAKDINFTTQRKFNSNLKEKYSDKEFIYIEEEEKKDSAPIDTSFLNGFVYFMTTIFPYLLGGIIIFIILKTFLGTETGFFNFKKHKKVPSEKLVFEDEDIHEVDLESLLKNAIAQKEYRLAIRYYYLSVLKELSTKKVINYHKDKTNSEYLFEIENAVLRKEFSYLSYVYTYVWYGEFPINEEKFKVVENKYTSFLKSNL
jgi:hypothetical protein